VVTADVLPLVHSSSATGIARNGSCLYHSFFDSSGRWSFTSTSPDFGSRHYWRKLARIIQMPLPTL